MGSGEEVLAVVILEIFYTRRGISHGRGKSVKCNKGLTSNKSMNIHQNVMRV